MKTLLPIFLLIFSTNVFTQVGISSNNAAPDASAMLDVSSVNKGMLLPRMTTAQKNAIIIPAIGLTVFDTDTKSYWYFDGTTWVNNGNNWTKNGNDIFNNNTGYVGIGLSLPTEKLHVANGNVQFGINDSDPFTFQNIFLWNGAKGALRAGNPTNSEWSLANLGQGSFATGYGTIASGVASVALNAGNTSTNYFSTSIGFGNNVTGQTATAIGFSNNASDPNSLVTGYKNLSNSTEDGFNGSSFVTGKYNEPVHNSLFSVGNGFAEFNPSGPPFITRKNAMVVMRNGETYLWGLNLGYKNTEAIINTNEMSKPIILKTFNTERMRIEANGYVGIGNSTPYAPLHVNGTVTTTGDPLSRAYFSNSTGTSIVKNTSISGQIQVRADGWFWANEGGFVATSDARIKNIISRTDSDADLDILKKIEITNYTFKDNVKNTAALQKKVIAQQVKSVYPIAINMQAGTIPNLFEIAKKVTVENDISTIETKTAHDFKTGDLVKIIIESGKEIEVIVSVKNPHEFTINQPVNDRVFVYGKKVNDLHTVDYDALTTLNISATQALLKRIEFLEKENNLIKNDIQEKMKIIEAKLNMIK